MGYTTEFSGAVEVHPPLNEKEIEYLKKFASTRRMDRKNGPYYVEGTGFNGQGRDADVINYNSPAKGQPGLWCQWQPTDDGTKIEWDGGEKFYNSVEWMQYLIDYFIGDNPLAKKELPFLNKHVLHGKIAAHGEDSDDHWFLLVENNKVSALEIEEEIKLKPLDTILLTKITTQEEVKSVNKEPEKDIFKKKNSRFNL